MKKIAVLMTCFNRANTTIESLRHLFAQKMPDGYSLDVWLVDDASPDKTGERVKAEFPRVNVVLGTGKLFWCRGMRRAWDCAVATYDYDFYLWLNDDVQLYDNAIQVALKDYEILGNRPLRVITGAFYDSEENKKVHYCTEQANQERLPPNDKFPQEGHNWFGGNFVLVPREVYEKIGPITNVYHHSFGDCDYAMRLEKAKIPFFSPTHVLGICPEANVRFVPLKSVPLFRRIPLLWNPNGYHLGDAFIYKYRTKGVCRAILSVGHVIVIVVLGIGNKRGGI